MQRCCATLCKSFVRVWSVASRLVRRQSVWCASARDPAVLFKANVGQAPSLADIVKMVHPKPKDPAREAPFGYFIGRDYAFDVMPAMHASTNCSNTRTGTNLVKYPTSRSRC